MGALGNLDHERFCQALHRRLWSGEKRSEALATVYRETMYRGQNLDDEAIKPNARRLANTKPIRARLGELNDYAAKLSVLDSNWAMLTLKKLADTAGDFTLEPYFRRSDAGARLNSFDLEKASKDQIAMLTEVQTETIVTRDEAGTETVRYKVKLKGPDKFSVVPSIVDKMATIGGWKAPTKIAPTRANGDDLTLEALVLASLAPAAEVAA